MGSWVLAATAGVCPVLRALAPVALPMAASVQPVLSECLVSAHCPPSPGPEPISMWGSLLARLAPCLGWPWAWCACSSGGHQEALIPISAFLAETRFAVSQPVRIWTHVFWLCLSFPLEAGMRGMGWEIPWAGSWMHGPLTGVGAGPGDVAQLPCLPKRGASAVVTRSGCGPGWA